MLLMCIAFVGTLLVLVLVRPFGLDQYQVAWDRVPGASPAVATIESPAADPVVDQEVEITEAWRDTGGAAAAPPWPRASTRSTSEVSSPSSTPKTVRKQDKRPVFFSSTNDEGADVYIDGRRRGATPITLHLNPGSYRLKFTGGDGDATKLIDVKQFGVDEFVFEPGALKITNKFR
jgi:hypothetical protein